MSYGQFFIALVDPNETTFVSATHARNDMDVASFSLAQKEGDFAVFTVTIKNPLEGLLSPTRKRHAWISWDGPSGIQPLFFGRVVGVPADINKMRTVITFRARPDEYETLKNALADSLRVEPYWDPIWVHPDNLSDADFVLQARTARYHIDRVTHQVTISDLIEAEDGTLIFGPEDGVSADSVNITYAGPGKSKVQVRAEVNFTQRALGTIDVTRALTNAFAIAGTTHPGMVSSYSWEHLAESWPLPGDQIGGGWSWFDANIEIGNQRWISEVDLLNNTLSIWASSYFGAIGEEFGFGFPTIETQYENTLSLGVMRPTMVAQFQAERSRVEIVEFTAVSDIQAILNEPGEDTPIQISLSSNDVGEPIEIDESGNTIAPIIDPRRTTYMKTDRGVQSMNYLMARARAELIDQARIVHITFVVPFYHVLDVSLRKSAVLTDPRLPGGQATGKIIGYTATGETGSGKFSLAITIACAIGNGGALVALPGDPVYVEDGYVSPGYQQYENAVILLGSGDLTYDDYRGYTVDDDGIDFFNPSAETMLLSVIVTNGPDQQQAQLEEDSEDPTVGGLGLNPFGVNFIAFQDVTAVKTAIARIRTQVCMDFKPVVGGPFETNIPVTVHPLVIPKQIDLEAA